MDKKKPIGYSKKDTSEMKALIERTEPKSGDYVGSGTVTEVPKKNKKMKRMMDGGMTRAAPYGRGKGPMSDALSNAMPVRSPGMGGGMGAPDYTTMPIRGGGGVPVQGPGGVVVPPMRPEGKKIPGQIRDRLMGMMGRAGKGTEYPGMPKKRGMKGGGLARKGVGMALAKGGLVKANGCAQRGKSKGKMV
jgi:hypothetical protein